MTAPVKPVTVLPYASRTVTVTEPVPPAATEAGTPVSENADAEPMATEIGPLVTLSAPSPADTVWDPIVFNVAENE